MFCVFVRASDDLNNNMLAVETMEQFQKELDKGKVHNANHFQSETLHCQLSPEQLINLLNLIC